MEYAFLGNIGSTQQPAGKHEAGDLSAFYLPKPKSTIFVEACPIMVTVNADSPNEEEDEAADYFTSTLQHLSDTLLIAHLASDEGYMRAWAHEWPCRLLRTLNRARYLLVLGSGSTVQTSSNPSHLGDV